MQMSALKKCVFFISTILVSPLYLLYRLLILCCEKNAVFSSFCQFLSLFPGKSGSYLRNSFLHLTMTNCEPEVVVSFGALFSQVDTEILSGTYIGPQCNIGSSRIGKNCLLGSGVHILSGKQQHSIDDLDTPIRDQGGTFTKVSIGEDTWIGNGAIIMADVGSQCVVAAGAVVVNPIADRVVVAGNPAVVVKERK